MKRITFILSLGSMIIYGISFFALIIAIILQIPIINILNNHEQTFIIPTSAFFKILSLLILSIIAFIASLKEKSSVWLNILLIIFPITLIPIGSYILTAIQNAIIKNDTNKIISLLYLNNIYNNVSLFNRIADAVYMVCCGIRISNSLKKD